MTREYYSEVRMFGPYRGCESCRSYIKLELENLPKRLEFDCPTCGYHWVLILSAEPPK
jgi:predicted RNA-binding Zn-ribbon protein involved in translation (DUF1610 family)